MGNFQNKKEEIKKAAIASGKTTFNRTQFDQLGTALLNEPGYVAKVAMTKGGKEIIEEKHPVEEFRDAMMGSLLKDAGLDSADAKKMIESYNFPTLPLHGVVSAMVEEYLDAGKAFSFDRKDDMTCTLRMYHNDEEIKTSRTPGKAGSTTTSKYGAHRIVKSTSKCPPNKKVRIN